MCWGANDHGQLGDGTTTDRLTPVPVTDLTDAIHVAAGAGHSCALRASGQAVCWGDNRVGQLGDGTTAERHGPVDVEGLSNAELIAAGGDQLNRGVSCAVRTTGQVVCWGNNDLGQLGDGVTHPTCDGALDCSLVPVDVTGLDDAVALTVGWGHVCAIQSPGTARCWGRNFEGEVGSGRTQRSEAPIDVTGLGDATHIAAGRYHTCAVRAAGQAVCWGNVGGFVPWAPGVLGNNTIGGSSTPVDVLGLSDATGIAAGEMHVCGVSSSSGVFCWGTNTRGELGDGTTVSKLRPAAAIGAGGA